jgi:hypothetical protein
MHFLKVPCSFATKRARAKAIWYPRRAAASAQWSRLQVGCGFYTSPPYRSCSADRAVSDRIVCYKFVDRGDVSHQCYAATSAAAATPVAASADSRP